MLYVYIWIGGRRNCVVCYEGVELLLHRKLLIGLSCVVRRHGHKFCVEISEEGIEPIVYVYV